MPDPTSYLRSTQQPLPYRASANRLYGSQEGQTRRRGQYYVQSISTSALPASVRAQTYHPRNRQYRAYRPIARPRRQAVLHHRGTESRCSHHQSTAMPTWPMPCYQHRLPPDIDLRTTCSEYCPTNPEVWRSHSPPHPRRKRSGAVHHARSGRYRWPRESPRRSDVLCLAHRNRLMRWRPPHCHKCMRRHREAPIPRSDSWARTTALAVPYRLDQRGTWMQTLLVLLKPVVEWRP